MIHNHSYENEFTLHVNEISFSYERMDIKTRFKKEAKGNSEMAYIIVLSLRSPSLFSYLSQSLAAHGSNLPVFHPRAWLQLRISN